MKYLVFTNMDKSGELDIDGMAANESLKQELEFKRTVENLEIFADEKMARMADNGSLTMQELDVATYGIQRSPLFGRLQKSKVKTSSCHSPSLS